MHAWVKSELGYLVAEVIDHVVQRPIVTNFKDAYGSHSLLMETFLCCTVCYNVGDCAVVFHFT